jgi:geranylgeranyl pyrophosphate synthase
LDPVDRFISRQGKMIRGGLLQQCFQLAGGVGMLPAGVAESIEWLHAGSLVIDDIQDQSHERRGEPTMHREIGQPLAINAANWMYFRALESLSQAALDSATSQRLLTEMISAARRCHEGQAIDLHARVDRLAPSLWKPVVEQISHLKTGTLLELAARMGAIAAGASQPLTTALARFGAEVGVVLQMHNDLQELAALAAPRADASQRDDDLRHARMTWPWAWAADVDANPRADPVEALRLAGQLSPLGPQRKESTKTLREVAIRLQSLSADFGAQLIDDYIARELRLLGEYVVDATALESLHQVLRPICQRPADHLSPTQYGAMPLGSSGKNEVDSC